MSAKSRAAELVELLDSEQRVYIELRDLLQRERTAMSAMDAAGLGAIVEEKEMLAAEARFLEEGRVDVARALAAELGLEQQRPTLSELALALGSDSGPLREIHATLVGVVGAVRELADANASFAGDSLAQVRDTLRLYGSFPSAAGTYGADACEARAASRPGRLLTRTA